jgi:DNA-binding response OmpR family regulator
MEECEMVKASLEDMNYKVVGHTDVQELMTIALNKKVELMLLNLCLPKRIGLSLARWVQNDSGLQHMPVLAFSAHNTIDLRAIALAFGCNDYFAIPDDIERMCQAVNILMNPELGEGGNLQLVNMTVKRYD